MKKLFLFLLPLLLFVGAKAHNIYLQKADWTPFDKNGFNWKERVRDIRFDAPPPPTNGIYDLKTDGGATGVEGADATSAWTTATNACKGYANTLHVPAGNYTFFSNNQSLPTGLFVKGDNANNCIFDINSSYTGSTSSTVFLSPQGSYNIRFENIQFKGNAKHIRAMLQFNSYNNGTAQMCPNIEFVNCIFDTLWADYALNFASASGNNVLDRIVDPLVKGCRFFDIYNPSYPIVTNDTDPKCDAINFEQTTNLGRVYECNFQRISGHGIFQWGWALGNATDTITTDPDYGGMIIKDNYFKSTWMPVEVNGRHLGTGLQILHNIVFDVLHNGGFAFSVACANFTIDGNDITLVDRAALELRGVNWECTNNKVHASNWTSTCGMTKSSKSGGYQEDLVEAYGFNGTIDGGLYRWDLYGTLDASSPTQFSGITFVGTNSEGVAHTQPENWDGIRDGYTGQYGYAGNFYIRNCLIQGYTGKAIYAEIVGQSSTPATHFIRNVFIDPTVTCSSTRAATNTILMLGFNWHVQCRIDNTGSPAIPTTSGVPQYGAFNVNSAQVGTAQALSGSIIEPIIIGNNWQVLHQECINPRTKYSYTQY